MPFACPGCGASIDRSPEAWFLRCSACAGVVRCRPLDAQGDRLAYEVELAGRPETRKRIELAWDASLQRRLWAWLAWSSAITLGLVLVLYALARLG
jgi:hypothetical protein